MLEWLIVIQFLAQVPKNRIDLLPHYSRLISTLNKYMPDIGSDIVAFVRETASELVAIH